MSDDLAHTVPGRNGSWIPWAFTGIFLLVVAVNGVMITFATSTFPGLVVERPFERGLAYESVIRGRAERAGLVREFSFDRREEGAVIRVLLASDTPFPPGQLEGSLTRPVGARETVSLAFVEQDGVHVTTIAAIGAGQWNLSLRLRDHSEVILDSRIVLP